MQIINIIIILIEKNVFLQSFQRALKSIYLEVTNLKRE